MKIGIVGAGISGMSAAYELQNSHTVTLLEAHDRIGGHANTIDVIDPNGERVSIDTGFIVFNRTNYPEFCAFLENIGTKFVDSDMSFSYSNYGSGYEYAGTIKGLLPRLKFFDVVNQIRFLMNVYRYSKLLADRREQIERRGMTLGEALKLLNCPDSSIENYFLPIASTIWSCKDDESRGMPATSFIDFFSNHGLLQLRNRPQWLTILGGSKEYLADFKSKFHGDIKMGFRVKKLIVDDNKTVVTSEKNEKMEFDCIVLAIHADDVLDIDANISDANKKILESYEYSSNSIYVHKDVRLMPRNRNVWASWNCIRADDNSRLTSNKIAGHTTYYMNRLQAINSPDDYFVTLNPTAEPAMNKLIYKTHYSHPVLKHSVETQTHNFNLLNDNRSVFFCGAHFGYGFHEDGFKSGNIVADLITSFGD